MQLRRWRALYNVREHRLAGRTEPRIFIENTILMKEGKVKSVIKKNYTYSKGGSISKVSKRIGECFRGVSRQQTCENLKAMKLHQRLGPIFSNKVPYKPVMSRDVQQVHQVDLVCMAKLADRSGTGAKYILSVMDIFSMVIPFAVKT